MNQKSLISKDLEDFYNQASEETRLEEGMGVFEFERIQSLIDNHLTDACMKIVDVGGGTGKYSAWLSEKGHQVDMVEPVDKHLITAEKRAKKLENPFSIVKGEAQNLDFADNYADLVILHGPLYHLQKKEDREQAIKEATRILKKGGTLLGFAINYAASTLVGLMSGMIHSPAFFKMCESELSSGVHNPPKEFPWLLADAYYHQPEQLKLEFESQDLHELKLSAVEGMVWLDKDFFSSIDDANKKTTLDRLLNITQDDPYLLSFSPHMMIAGKK